jgi:hypothetical protein
LQVLDSSEVFLLLGIELLIPCCIQFVLQAVYIFRLETIQLAFDEDVKIAGFEEIQLDALRATVAFWSFATFFKVTPSVGESVTTLFLTATSTFCLKF